MTEEGYVMRSSYVLPPKLTWEWCVGGDWFAMTIRIPMKPPRGWWFYRLMHRWVLGIHWRRCT